MKKYLRICFAAFALILIVSACGTKEAPPAAADNEETRKEEPVNGETSTEGTGAEGGEAEETVSVWAEVTSLDMARKMGYGINLGNTMEACNSSDRVPGQDPAVYERLWGQPVTTQATVSGMKAAGFDTLRIPVAWGNAMKFAVNNEMDYENWDYTIDEAYFARVEEIINYALDEDMIVIINDHWDHGWWSMFGHKDQKVRGIAMDIMGSMWSQIAERYKAYDARLVFEGGNEELGNRFNDSTVFTQNEPGTLTEDECYALLTSVAQKFVDSVRASGGNNSDRFLLIPGYGTDITDTSDARFKMPSDTAQNKLMLSVHYYTPWSYCGDTSGVAVWGTVSEVEEQNRLLGLMEKYTAQGYGIVLGEWGVLDNTGPDRDEFFANFLNNCDKYGYSPILWDTGGLYNRTSGVITDDAVAEIFKGRKLAKSADGMTVDALVSLADGNISASLEKAAQRPQTIISADEAFAWIMFANGDWSVQYSVGDEYIPDSIAAGLTANDPEITGAGTYTVSLDLTGLDAGYADGIAFSAVGIMNGEVLFPGYIIDITELLINGEPAELSGKPYTTNDNDISTRVNLYNQWGGNPPPQARTPDGDLTDVTAVPLESYVSAQIETISVTFDYAAPSQ